jgi:hypothetical protein
VHNVAGDVFGRASRREAPGRPKMTMRFRTVAAADTVWGVTGHASPNSVDSVRVASDAVRS